MLGLILESEVQHWTLRSDGIKFLNFNNFVDLFEEITCEHSLSSEFQHSFEFLQFSNFINTQLGFGLFTGTQISR